MIDKIERFLHRNRNIKRNTDELIWAEAFQTSIRNSRWFNKGISPGRWAVGFQYCYVMYRVLDELQPDMILELGTGQTTKMICDYLLWNKDADHIAVEQNADWVSYLEKIVDFNRSEILIMPIELKLETINGKKARVTRYDGFKDKLLATGEKYNRKYDFISIDGPSTIEGQTKNVSARRDILEIIPEFIADDFTIMLDDIDRKSNRALAREIADKISKEKDVRYGEYWGQKGVAVIAGGKHKWVTSM